VFETQVVLAAYGCTIPTLGLHLLHWQYQMCVGPGMVAAVIIT
jgi:hypothetical protein